jgi:hypothetical protein
MVLPKADAKVLFALDDYYRSNDFCCEAHDRMTVALKPE